MTTSPTPSTSLQYSVIDALGRVIRSGSCPNSALSNRIRPEEAYTLVPLRADPRTQYFALPLADPPVAAARPPSTVKLDKNTFAADGKDAVTITGIPAGAIVRINGLPMTDVADGILVFRSTRPSGYTLQVLAFPAMDFVGTFVSTPPAS
jgi:hypothetical protein